ncbi:MAG: hypothetical protein PUA90_02300 [bacterium]|nr:hypothetical protein [bacterium]
MKVTKTEILDKDSKDPISFHELELDTITEINDISAIIEKLPKDLHYTIISISGGYDSYDRYDLDFDSFDEVLDYVEKNNMDDASYFIVKSQFGLDNLDFGFELNTNRMNTSYCRHTDEEVFALIQSIENNIKEKKNNRPMNL